MDKKEVLKKHAYLIIANRNWRQLEKLVSLLDDARNDIFVHIDAKSDINDLSLNTHYSKLFFCERMDIRWGDISLVQAELALFRYAYHNGIYEYYHLLSGLDLPLHNQDYIHEFFNSHSGSEFIGFGKTNWDVSNRVYCHNVFLSQMRNPWKISRYTFKIMRIVCNKIQHILHYKTVPLGNYRYGCEWVSVTHLFVKALISESDKFNKTYRYAYCPDEIYKQTFAVNSQFMDKIYDIHDEFHGCVREIDWNRGLPYVWRASDYEYLSKSDKMFARKFDENIDNEIIDMIINKVKNEQAS